MRGWSQKWSRTCQEVCLCWSWSRNSDEFPIRTRRTRVRSCQRKREREREWERVREKEREVWDGCIEWVRQQRGREQSGKREEEVDNPNENFLGISWHKKEENMSVKVKDHQINHFCFVLFCSFWKTFITILSALLFWLLLYWSSYNQWNIFI